MKILQTTLFLFIGILLYSCMAEKNNADAENPLEAHEVPEFSIQFPKTNYSVRKSEFVDEKQNGVVVTNWVVEGTTDDDPFKYFLEFNEVPEKLHPLIHKDSNSLNSTFRRVLTKAGREMGARQFDFQSIQYNGLIGMESRSALFDGAGIIKSRVFKVNNDFFIVSGGGKNIDTNTVNRFLNSFELLSN